MPEHLPWDGDAEQEGRIECEVFLPLSAAAGDARAHILASGCALEFVGIKEENIVRDGDNAEGDELSAEGEQGTAEGAKQLELPACAVLDDGDVVATEGEGGFEFGDVFGGEPGADGRYRILGAG